VAKASVSREVLGKCSRKVARGLRDDTLRNGGDQALREGLAKLQVEINEERSRIVDLKKGKTKALVSRATIFASFAA
jgi:hypothetical protein